METSETHIQGAPITRLLPEQTPEWLKQIYFKAQTELPVLNAKFLQKDRALQTINKGPAQGLHASAAKDRLQ